MKSFLTLALALCMNSAFAEGVTALAGGDISIYQASAAIASVQPYCPATPGGAACSAYGSTVNVQVSLSGCVDRFAGHFSRFEVINGRGYLFFGALSIFNQQSRNTRCVAAPTKLVKVYVPHQGSIQLVDMEFTGTTLPQH